MSTDTERWFLVLEVFEWEQSSFLGLRLAKLEQPEGCEGYCAVFPHYVDALKFAGGDDRKIVPLRARAKVVL